MKQSYVFITFVHIAWAYGLLEPSHSSGALPSGNRLLPRTPFLSRRVGALSTGLAWGRHPPWGRERALERDALSPRDAPASPTLQPMSSVGKLRHSAALRGHVLLRLSAGEASACWACASATSLPAQGPFCVQSVPQTTEVFELLLLVSLNVEAGKEAPS